MDREDARLSARDGRAQSWDGAQLSGRDGLAGFATGQPAAGAGDGSEAGCVARACKRLRPSAGAAALPPIKGLTDASSFGNKTIGYWSSCCLNLNNVMGAAIVALPLVNQQAGWLTPTLAILFVFVVSSFAATMLVEAMQRVPGNHDLKARWEFCALAGHFFGPRAQTAVSWLYNISLQSTNVAAMIVSAQILDVFIVYTVGHSVALDYHEWPPRFIRSESSISDPWLTQWVISAGFLLSAVIAIPLGYINLEDNMGFQWASLVGLLLFTCEFFVQFALEMTPGTRWEREDPTWGPDKMPTFKSAGQYQVLGMAIFAYAYVTTIPSWANEKVPDVNVNSAVWWPAVVGTGLKLLAGILGGFAFRLVRENGEAQEGMDNILNRLVEPDMPAVTIYSAYFWNISTLIPGIPVLAIMVRYNLLNSGVAGPKMAFFLGVVAPWLVTMFCYQASVLVSICNWSALLTIGAVNLVVPIAIYREALLRYGGAKSFLAGRCFAFPARDPSETRPLLNDGPRPAAVRASRRRALCYLDTTRFAGWHHAGSAGLASARVSGWCDRAGGDADNRGDGVLLPDHTAQHLLAVLGPRRGLRRHAVQPPCARPPATMFARPQAMMLAHSQASQTLAPTAVPAGPTCPSGGE